MALRSIFSRRRASWAGATFCLLALVWCTSAQAAKKSYSYETDPVRLGMKAIEEQRYDDARANFQEALANEYEMAKAQYGQAEILRREGSYADAEARYREALATQQKEKGNPEFPECDADLGLTLLRLGRSEEAGQEFQKALDAKGGLWDAQYGMARIAIEKGDFDGALKLLDKGSRKKGLSDGADMYHFGMGLALMGKGDLDGAEKEALNALNMNPGDPEYGILVAQIYTKKGALPLAIEAMEKALAQPGARPTAAVLHNLGQLYQQEMYQMYKEGNHAEQVRLGGEALRKYQESVKLDSTYAVAWKDMGGLLALANKYDEAAGAYVRYAQLNSSDPDAMLGLAEACMKGKVKRYKQAMEAATRAYSLDSTRVEARLMLARASFLNGDKVRARNLYLMISDTLKFAAEDYTRLGQLKLEAPEDLPGAEKDLKRALDRDSTMAEAWYALGRVAMKREDYQGALNDFQRAAVRDPENPMVKLNIGITYLRMKQNLESLPPLREAVRLAPNAAQARITLAQALMINDSLSAAIDQYTQARNVDPKNALAVRGLGLGYLLKKDYAQAISVLQEATTLDPTNVDAFVWMAQAVGSKGDYQKALDILDKALAINPNHAKAKELRDVLKKGLQAQGGKK